MSETKIRKATENDCRAIAELALLAGEGIPAYFWEQTKRPGESLVDAGAKNAAAEKGNFSYCNALYVSIFALAIRLSKSGLSFLTPAIRTQEIYCC